MRTRVKICGVRTVADVRAAVAAGADAIGLNLYPRSLRSVDLALAAGLAAAVPPYVEPVALFVDPVADEVLAAADRLRLRGVQLHGQVTPALLTALRALRVTVSLRVAAGETVARATALHGQVAGLVLDAAVPGEHGGTGCLADWAEAARVREALPEVPVVLAGGLSPANVAAAVRAVRPYAVDVASGVERAPGVKDPELMRAFVEAVRRTDG